MLFTMDSDTSRPRRQNSTTTRARIVEVAAAYFTRKPFSKVSLKEIATEAGVSAPLIIKYFRTKEGLLEELINFEAMKDLICEVPFGDIGTSLADDAINGDRLHRGRAAGGGHQQRDQRAGGGAVAVDRVIGQRRADVRSEEPSCRERV